MFLFKLVFLDKESKLYLLLYVDVCSRTAHLFYSRELKNIETNHEKNLYCVINRKVTGHYFFSEKKKSIIQTNPSYNDLKESCYYLVLFFNLFFCDVCDEKYMRVKSCILWQLFSFKKTVEISLFISFPIPPQCVKKGCLPLVNLTW